MNRNDLNAEEYPGTLVKTQKRRTHEDSHHREATPEQAPALTDRLRTSNWNDAARQTLDAWNAFASGQSPLNNIKMPNRLPALCSCYLWLKSVEIVKPDSPGLNALELRLTDRIAGLLNVSPKTAEIHAGAMMLRMVFTQAQRTGTDLGAAIERTMNATTDAEKSSMKWTGIAIYRL